MNKYWIDAHCHLNELDIKNILSKKIKQAKKSNIKLFLSSALCESEYEWHKKSGLPNMLWYAGIHPVYEKSDLKDLPTIIELAESKKIIGIGEIGLDTRDFDEQKQTDLLLEQLNIANEFDLPVIFHIVGKYYELFKLLKNNFPRVRGILHGFNASQKITEIFTKFDLTFSIGCRFPKLEVLKFILKYGNYCFETDAPYQKPYASVDEFNHLSNLLVPINFIIQNLNIEREKLLDRQFQIIRNLFPQICKTNNLVC
ncbi:MAG: TatD family hydrolase [Candidatus Cloacimonetes bacterium]|nr:TatD family hydrolase [Candidatus Cloacimonadota bacterium]